MLAQDVSYFIDKQIPCSSSGYHIFTQEDYIEYQKNHTEANIIAMRLVTLDRMEKKDSRIA